MRVVATPDEFFDILDKIKNGQYITLGYVASANVKMPVVKRKNPLTNMKKGYPDYSVLESPEEIGALVQITAYNFRYYSRDKFNVQYEAYKKSANAVRSEFGLDPIQDRQGYKSGTSWSPKGPSLYNGKNDDLKSHSYTSQNMYNPKSIKSVVYAVNQEGHIIKAFTKDEISQYFKKKREIDGVAALKNMGADEERIKSYIDRIGELKFKYKTFESNSILWIAATVDGEKIIYINDNLQRCVDGINILPQDFRAIARERYQIELNDLYNNNVQESKNMNNKKQLIRLTESDLHRIVKESVKKVIKETTNATNNGSNKPLTGKLIKKLENDSDFQICVYEFIHPVKGKVYAVTCYDPWFNKHIETKRFTKKEKAMMCAKEWNNGYKH